MSANSVHLLAIAPSCVESVNRGVYRHLANSHHLGVHLVMPMHYRVGNHEVPCAPVDQEPFATALLEPMGSQNRLYGLRRLRALIKALHPSYVLLETGPATRLAWEAVSATRGTASKIWAISVENQERHFFREGLDQLRHQRFGGAAGAAIAWGLWRALRSRVDRVFTLSQESSRVIGQLGFEGPITQIPLGFDPALFYIQNAERIRATRERLGLHTRTVAYFGRIVREKGLDLLLRALSNLRDVDWQLLIDRFSQYHSPYVVELTHLVEELGIGDRVVFFDASHREMPDYMNAADITVLPSITTPKFKEQYGRVLPESMACGKIVIASESGALPELVGDAGFVFPEGDIASLTRLLRTVLTASENDLKPMREKAHARACQHFSIDRQAQIWAELMQEEKTFRNKEIESIALSTAIHVDQR